MTKSPTESIGNTKSTDLVIAVSKPPALIVIGESQLLIESAVDTCREMSPLTSKEKFLYGCMKLIVWKLFVEEVVPSFSEVTWNGVLPVPWQSALDMPIALRAVL